MTEPRTSPKTWDDLTEEQQAAVLDALIKTERTYNSAHWKDVRQRRVLASQFVLKDYILYSGRRPDYWQICKRANISVMIDLMARDAAKDKPIV